MKTEELPSRLKAAIAHCVPHLKQLTKGRCAVSLGGSIGKGTADEHSDIDFRLFCDEFADGDGIWASEPWKEFSRAVESFREQGIIIDGCWPRTIGEVEAKLDGLLNGTAGPDSVVWSIWGYQLLTDITNQFVIEDPDGVIASLQARLSPYPQALKAVLLKKHMESLNYWRADYHFQSKVERGDAVFLANLAAKLVHDMIQILFALNETYYVGDGNNLRYVSSFSLRPGEFEARVTECLYPRQSDGRYAKQREDLLSLIDEVSELATSANPT